MSSDPCAHVNGVTKPTYVHHRVLGRLRPRGHKPKGPVHPVAHHVDPGIDAGCRRDVILSRKTTFPLVAKVPAVLTVAALTGGPTPPPIPSSAPPAHTVVPPTPVITPPSHPQQIVEPASLFLMLAGLVVLASMRRTFAGARAA